MTDDGTQLPDPALRYVVGFSGGKDSVATYLHLSRELGLPRVECVMADTGHEAALTYEYVGMLRDSYGFPITMLQPILADFDGAIRPEKLCARLGVEMDQEGNWRNLPFGMEELAIVKRRFPSSMARFCTSFLKIIPKHRWTKANCDPAETVVVSGVRAQESPARAKHPKWSVEKETGCRMWLPIHQWSHDDVFDCHRRHNVPPNPLYKLGCGRVGCYPCIMSRKSELAAMALRDADASFGRLREMEVRVAAAVGKPEMSFFGNDTTPARFHTATCENSGKTFPTADDVKRWAMHEEPANSGQATMFTDDDTEDAFQCSSIYGLCE